MKKYILFTALLYSINAISFRQNNVVKNSDEETLRHLKEVE